MALVDECYPAECIKFRRILSVTQLRFQVKGAPSSGPQGPCSPPLQETPVVIEESLPLKPEGKQQPQTQRLSEPSYNRDFPKPDHAPQFESPDENVEIVRDSFPSRERDALDDVIEEAKAVEHLVRLLDECFLTVLTLLLASGSSR